MKRITAMLLAVLMVLGLFTACGGKTPENTAPADPLLNQGADDSMEQYPTLIW